MIVLEAVQNVELESAPVFRDYDHFIENLAIELMNTHNFGRELRYVGGVVAVMKRKSVNRESQWFYETVTIRLEGIKNLNENMCEVDILVGGRGFGSFVVREYYGDYVLYHRDYVRITAEEIVAEIQKIRGDVVAAGNNLEQL